VSLALVLAVVGQGLLALVPLVQQIIVDDVLLDPTQSLGFWIVVLCSLGVLSFVSHALRCATDPALGDVVKPSDCRKPRCVRAA